MVRLSKELVAFLKQQGYKGESYDQIIRRLIEQVWNAKIPVEAGK